MATASSPSPFTIDATSIYGPATRAQRRHFEALLQTVTAKKRTFEELKAQSDAALVDLKRSLAELDEMPVSKRQKFDQEQKARHDRVVYLRKRLCYKLREHKDVVAWIQDPKTILSPVRFAEEQVDLEHSMSIDIPYVRYIAPQDNSLVVVRLRPYVHVWSCKRKIDDYDYYEDDTYPNYGNGAEIARRVTTFKDIDTQTMDRMTWDQVVNQIKPKWHLAALYVKYMDELWSEFSDSDDDDE